MYLNHLVAGSTKEKLIFVVDICMCLEHKTSLACQDKLILIRDAGCRTEKHFRGRIKPKVSIDVCTFSECQSHNYIVIKGSLKLKG